MACTMAPSFLGIGKDAIGLVVALVLQLCDDVRTSLLGVGFAHTHEQQIQFKDANGQTARGVCSVRIDRIYSIRQISQTLS